MHKKKKIIMDYERRNGDIINDLIAKKISIREALIEMNKNLGNVFVKELELKNIKD